MVDAIVRDIWYVAGLGAALALVVLLLCRHVFESHLGPRTRTALNIALELGSNVAIKDAVRRGLGVAFLSDLAVRKDLDSQELTRIEVEGLTLRREFYAVSDRRRPLPPQAVAFLRFAEANPLPPAEC